MVATMPMIPGGSWATVGLLVALAMLAIPSHAAGDAPAAGSGPAFLPGTPPPEVLIINSYVPGYPWGDALLASVQRGLRDRYPAIKPSLVFLDLDRFPSEQRESWLIEDLAYKVKQRSPRLIITLDDPAYVFSMKHRARLGAEVPIVFGGINRLAGAIIEGQTGVTGVAEEADYVVTFDLIRRLCPERKRMLVIGTQLHSAKATMRSFREVVPAREKDFQFEYYDTWTNEQLFERVAGLNDEWVVLAIDLVRDATGRETYYDDTFPTRLRESARVPVFMRAQPVLGEYREWPGLGGGLIVVEKHAEKVVEYALRALAGENLDSIPMERFSPVSLEVDYRLMKRHGLSFERLPAGARIVDAPQSSYAIHVGYIISALALLVVLAGAVFVLLLNIRLRKRAERELLAAEARLHTSQKLEAIGLLAGGVAHDFNNILQVIQGHAGFLSETVGNDPACSEDVREIREAAARAASLTRQLLAFGRRQTLRHDQVDLDALIRDMVRMVSRLLGEHIQVEVEPMAETVLVRGDASQLEQVLMNLCLNARDAMPAGGRLRIALKRVRIDSPVASGKPDLRAGTYVELSVSDTGGGMSPEVQKRIFEPFFSTKAMGKGTGLGLAVVYGIVRQHEGAISVYSEVGHGSVFKILLPMCSAPAEDSVPAQAEPGHPSPAAAVCGRGSVLLAEDDAQVRAFAVRVLERAGFSVWAACDGTEAIALFDRHAAELGIAIVDLVMPGRSGKQVYAHIRSKNAHLPVLFCSGYSAEILPEELAPGGLVDLVHKPYTASELLAQIDRVMRAGSVQTGQKPHTGSAG